VPQSSPATPIDGALINGVGLSKRKRGNPLTGVALGDMLNRQARRAPGKSAVVCYRGRDRIVFTYAELNEIAQRYATALGKLAQIGDVVAAVLPPSAGFIASYFGALFAGTPFTGVNPGLTADELAYQLDHVEARVVLVSESTRPAVEAVLANCAVRPVLLTVADDGMTVDGEPLPAPGPRRPIDESDVAAIIYTSGTESRPKGVMLSHRTFLIGTTPSWVYANYLVERDIFLLLAPMYTMAGLGTLTNLMSCGGTVVLLDNLESVRLLDVIRDEKITVMSQTPTFYRRLVASPAFDSADLTSLRHCHVYAGDIDENVLGRFRDRCPDLEWAHYWGQSELGQLGTVGYFRSLSDIPAGNTRWIGRPMPHVEIRVVEEDGHDAALGELVCRSPSIMLGYYKDEALTATVLHDDWLRTGDIVSVDESGNLFFEDRKKDMVKTGGMNVSTSEVEGVLREHPAVLAVAVFGLPDAEWSEVVVAAVVGREGYAQDPEQLRAYCRAHLAGYKIPKYVYFVAGLPYDGQGKVRKRDLRAQVGAEHARTVA